MTGVLGWSRGELFRSTARELIVAYEAREVSNWDRTAVQSALIHNLSIIVSSMFSKKRPEAVSMFDYHPYRSAPRAPATTPERLKAMGEAWKAAGGKVRKRRKRKDAGVSDSQQGHV